MKKYTLLLVSLFFAVTTFAQAVRTESDITGLGQFRFGTRPKLLEEPMMIHMTEDSEIHNNIEKDLSLMITNMTLYKYIFDVCQLKFNIKGLLSQIAFYKVFDRDDKSLSEVFVKIRHALEKEYGNHERGYDFDSDSNIMHFVWNDSNGYTIIFSLTLGEDGEKHSILLTAVQELE